MKKMLPFVQFYVCIHICIHVHMFNSFGMWNKVVINFLPFCKGLMRHIFTIFITATTLKVTVLFFHVWNFSYGPINGVSYLYYAFSPERLDLQLYYSTWFKYIFVDYVFFCYLLLVLTYMLLLIRTKSPYVYGHHHTGMGPHTCMVIFF